MGLFSGKTIINVASSVYNLAGEEKDRSIFLQNLLIRNILSGTKRSIAETVMNGYITGPGIKFRNFYKWALDNYDLIGMPIGQMYAGDTLNTDIVAEQIPSSFGETIWVQSARLGDSDYEMWAEQYMIENHPELLSSNWQADMDDITKVITIEFDPTLPAMPNETFVASNFFSGSKYIFAYYTKSEYNIEGSVVTDAPIILGSDPFPTLVDYTLFSTDTEPRTEELVTETSVLNTYSDGRPDESSFTVGSTFPTVNKITEVYTKTTFIGDNPGEDSIISNRNIKTFITDEKVTLTNTVNIVNTDIGGGVTRTTTTTIDEEILEQNNSYINSNQETTNQNWGPLTLYIYLIGSGNLILDAFIEKVADYGKFFPIIPFRINNKFVSKYASDDLDAIDPNWKSIHKLVKKAFRKGTDGGKYNDIEASLNDSESIADMDYIYTVYGVSLNCLDRSARRYIYEFFKRLQNDQAGGDDSGVDFAVQMEAYKAAYDLWLLWRQDASEPPPEIPPKPALPTNEIRMQTFNVDIGINYDIRINWHFITESINNIGKGKPTAKKNDIWLEYRGKTIIDDPLYTGENSFGSGGSAHSNVISNNKIEYETIRVWWQYETNKYKYLDVAGLVHKNFVYGGKNVTITAKEALEDSEESGFLVPLHYATFKAMPLIHATQMSTACMFLVINTYEARKQKWWESWFFKIILTVVIAILSVVFTGGAGIGLLGSHLAVGSFFGLTGMSAAIAGSIANALAALVLTTVIQKLTANLGIFGTILSAVLSIIIGGGISNASMGLGFKFDFSQLMKAENILKLTDAAGRGYAGYVESSIMGMQNDLTALQDQANNELNKIQESFVSQFGYGGGQIDPMMFTSANNPAKYVELRDTFLARTLMTGTDVAEMSFDLLNNMADLTLTLPNAFSD